MNEDIKQIYGNLLKNINTIVSILDSLSYKVNELSDELNNYYKINDVNGNYSIIDNSKNDIENIKKFLSNDIRVEILENINQINNRF